MGSLANTNRGRTKPADPCETLFKGACLERQVTSIKSRLHTEVHAWLDNLSLQLTKIGKEMLEEVEETLRDGSTDMEAVDIKFIPKRIDVGYMSFHGILPTDLHVMLSSGIGEVRVGARVLVRVEGPCMRVRNHLVVSVCTQHSDVAVTCQEEDGYDLSSGSGESLQYSITLPSEGLHSVTATLYKQHIIGSPLVIPVHGDLNKVLGDIGLGIADGQSTSSSELAPMENIVRAKKELPVGAVADLSPGLVVGDSVYAKWEEDGVWYNAEVLRPLEGGCDVLFSDYGNESFVPLRDISRDVQEIPEGEALDVNVEILLDHIMHEEAENMQHSGSSRKETISYGTLQGTSAKGGTQPKDVVDRGRVMNVERSNNAGRPPLVCTNFENSVTPSYEKEGLRGAIADTSRPRKPLASTSLVDWSKKTSVEESSWSYKEDTNNNATNISLLVKGARVLVKWNDVENWRRAVIHDIVTPGSLYNVKYVDNGQVAVAHPDYIVLETEDVEKRLVGSESYGWVVGDSCIAKWLDDNVWYNAVVLSVGKMNCAVEFVDYGNEDSVNIEDMVKVADEIPPGSLVDEHVNRDIIKEIALPKDKSASKAPRPLKPGSLDQAKKLGSKTSEDAQSVFCQDSHSVSSVPPSLQCCLCGNLCRKGMRVACSSTGVCWGCAVKKITSTHVCWQCGEKGITTDSHLVRDQVLRSFVEQFVKTGKLDPAQEQALKNGQVQSGTRVEGDGCKASMGKQLQLGVEDEKRGLIQNVSKNVKVALNNSCVAKFSEDGIWYNGVVTEIYGDGSALVYFTDYGNSERVKGDDILRGSDDVPHGEIVDPHVHGGATNEISFLSNQGESSLNAKEIQTLKDLEGPMGVTVLPDRSLMVVCRGANKVYRYSQEGNFLGVVKPGREFVKPSDILTLASGELVVRDDRGIQLFGSDLQFIKFVAEETIDRCFGLAEDGGGRIITINQNLSSVVKITAANCTDVFFIDKLTSRVVKRIEMVDLIEDAMLMLGTVEPDMSACRFLTHSNKRLYVVDHGLDCIFILNEDGTESELFGRRGTKGGEFRDPAGLVVDECGTMMVADSRNHRLQLIDHNLAFAGLVQVDVPLARPSGLYVDKVNKEIIVSNYQGKSVVRYKMVTKNIVT